MSSIWPICWMVWSKQTATETLSRALRPTGSLRMAAKPGPSICGTMSPGWMSTEMKRRNWQRTTLWPAWSGCSTSIKTIRQTCLCPVRWFREPKNITSTPRPLRRSRHISWQQGTAPNSVRWLESKRRTTTHWSTIVPQQNHTLILRWHISVCIRWHRAWWTNWESKAYRGWTTKICGTTAVTWWPPMYREMKSCLCRILLTGTAIASGLTPSRSRWWNPTMLPISFISPVRQIMLSWAKATSRPSAAMKTIRTTTRWWSGRRPSPRFKWNLTMTRETRMEAMTTTGTGQLPMRTLEKHGTTDWISPITSAVTMPSTRWAVRITLIPWMGCATPATAPIIPNWWKRSWDLPKKTERPLHVWTAPKQKNTNRKQSRSWPRRVLPSR